MMETFWIRRLTQWFFFPPKNAISIQLKRGKLNFRSDLMIWLHQIECILHSEDRRKSNKTPPIASFLHHDINLVRCKKMLETYRNDFDCRTHSVHGEECKNLTSAHKSTRLFPGSPFSMNRCWNKLWPHLQLSKMYCTKHVVPCRCMCPQRSAREAVWLYVGQLHTWHGGKVILTLCIDCTDDQYTHEALIRACVGRDNCSRAIYIWVAFNLYELPFRMSEKGYFDGENVYRSTWIVF